jgi:hypothetical protein
MRLRNRIRCVVAVVATMLAAPLSAQGDVPAGALPRSVVDVRLLPPAAAGANAFGGGRLELHSAAVTTLAGTRRPWWLIPLASAGAGALLFEIVRGDECEQSDCIIYIPPPVQGAVLGLAVGTVIEVVLRASDR